MVLRGFIAALGCLALCGGCAPKIADAPPIKVQDASWERLNALAEPALSAAVAPLLNTRGLSLQTHFEAYEAKLQSLVASAPRRRGASETAWKRWVCARNRAELLLRSDTVSSELPANQLSLIGHKTTINLMALVDALRIKQQDTATPARAQAVQNELAEHFLQLRQLVGQQLSEDGTMVNWVAHLGFLCEEARQGLIWDQSREPPERAAVSGWAREVLLLDALHYANVLRVKRAIPALNDALRISLAWRLGAGSGMESLLTSPEQLYRQFAQGAHILKKKVAAFQSEEPIKVVALDGLYTATQMGD